MFPTILRALNTALPQFSFDLSDSARVEELKRGWAAKSPIYSGARTVMHNIVGAIDGIAVKIRKPRVRSDKVSNPDSFFCRKGFFALNVQAICDADKKKICG